MDSLACFVWILIQFTIRHYSLDIKYSLKLVVFYGINKFKHYFTFTAIKCKLVNNKITSKCEVIARDFKLLIIYKGNCENKFNNLVFIRWTPISGNASLFFSLLISEPDGFK